MFYSRAQNIRAGGTSVETLVISIAVVLCVAYLLWQIYEADLIDR